MMHKRFTKVTLLCLVLASVSTGLFAFQRGQWGGGRGNDYGSVRIDRRGVPDWEIDENFKKDTFTFARVQYSDGGRRGYGGGGYGGFGYGRRGRGGGGKWRIDYPDSDLNFSLRLQQLTSLKVNPDPVVVRLTDPDVFDYPFLYMIEPGDLLFSEEEVVALRKYLNNGGFMMVDDFWGEEEYANFEREIKRVFPDKPIDEVPLEHEIFQCVYPLKERPQVPALNTFLSGYTYEWRRSGSEEVHYRSIMDEAGRIMVFICHNTDLGDGWEREGENHEYFKEFAVKKSYPLGINIVTYAMTH
ncbi:MAG: DUF4159 domain-containing protein [Planctomycetota bacterium]